MKTIAVSIDEPTLRALDQLVRQLAKRRARRPDVERAGGRSSIVREALHRFLAEQERLTREQGDALAYAKHRTRVGQQARMLLDEQAAP